MRRAWKRRRSNDTERVEGVREGADRGEGRGGEEEEEKEEEKEEARANKATAEEEEEEGGAGGGGGGNGEKGILVSWSDLPIASGGHFHSP